MAKRKKKEPPELNPDKLARALLARLGLYTEIRHLVGRGYGFWATGHGDSRTRDPLVVYGAIVAVQIEQDGLRDGWRLRLHVEPVDVGLGALLTAFLLEPQERPNPVEWTARACRVHRPQWTPDDLLVGRLTLY